MPCMFGRGVEPAEPTVEHERLVARAAPSCGGGSPTRPSARSRACGCRPRSSARRRPGSPTAAPRGRASRRTAARTRPCTRRRDSSRRPWRATAAIAGIGVRPRPAGTAAPSRRPARCSGPTAAAIASTSAVQSSRHGRLVDRHPELVGRLVERGVRALGEDDLRLGDRRVRRGRARGRRARRTGSTPSRRWSGSRRTSPAPCSRSAVQPTTSDWIWRSDGNACVFSAFSCRYSRAACSATSWTDGPPS